MHTQIIGTLSIDTKVNDLVTIILKIAILVFVAAGGIRVSQTHVIHYVKLLQLISCYITIESPYAVPFVVYFHYFVIGQLIKLRRVKINFDQNCHGFPFLKNPCLNQCCWYELSIFLDMMNLNGIWNWYVMVLR